MAPLRELLQGAGMFNAGRLLLQEGLLHIFRSRSYVPTFGLYLGGILQRGKSSTSLGGSRAAGQ
jgi:hypothetical protein